MMCNDGKSLQLGLLFFLYVGDNANAKVGLTYFWNTLACGGFFGMGWKVD